MGGSNSTTVATAGKFHATFDDNNRIQTLHGCAEFADCLDYAGGA